MTYKISPCIQLAVIQSQALCIQESDVYENFNIAVYPHKFMRCEIENHLSFFSIIQ